MTVILQKSWTNVFGRKYPVGQKIMCDKNLRAFLVNNGYAKDYDGNRRIKVKTDFFKPKQLK